MKSKLRGFFDEKKQRVTDVAFALEKNDKIFDLYKGRSCVYIFLVFLFDFEPKCIIYTAYELKIH